MWGYITKPEHVLSLGFANYLMLRCVYRTHDQFLLIYSSFIISQIQKTGQFISSAPFILTCLLAKALTQFHHIPESKSYHHISLRRDISIYNRCEAFQSSLFIETFPQLWAIMASPRYKRDLLIQFVLCYKVTRQHRHHLSYYMFLAHTCCS